MAKKVLVAVADGTEEIEAVCVIDTLRRAEAEVTVASVDGRQIKASRGVNIVADKLISECTAETYDLIVLPGGMPGAEHLRDSKDLQRLLESQRDQGRLYAAICAAPAVVLAHHGLLLNKHATCHPAFVDQLDNQDDVDSPVVVDGNCVTSRGPGTALEFALKLVELLYSREEAYAISQAMVAPV